MSELRWALLIVGAVFFAALTVWELRRPRQARSREARGSEPPAPPLSPPAPTFESDLELPEMHAREPLAARHPPLLELPADPEALPVLEPAAPVTLAETEPFPEAEPVANLEPLTDIQPPDPAIVAPETAGPGPAAEAAPERAEEAAPAADLGEAVERELPELPAAPAPRVDWPPDEERQVVALRLVATQPDRFPGRSLRQALAAEGFVLGRFDIFHKGDEERRAILSAASLTRPGTFDSDTMDSQHFGGLSLFAVLPGPMSPPEAFEELVATARSLNDRLCGVLQDEAGTPLTPARIATLRERLSSGVPS